MAALRSAGSGADDATAGTRAVHAGRAILWQESRARPRCPVVGDAYRDTPAGLPGCGRRQPVWVVVAAAPCRIRPLTPTRASSSGRDRGPASSWGHETADRMAVPESPSIRERA